MYRGRARSARANHPSLLEKVCAGAPTLWGILSSSRHGVVPSVREWDQIPECSCRSGIEQPFSRLLLLLLLHSAPLQRVQVAETNDQQHPSPGDARQKVFPSYV